MDNFIVEQRYDGQDVCVYIPNVATQHCIDALRNYFVKSALKAGLGYSLFTARPNSLSRDEPIAIASMQLYTNKDKRRMSHLIDMLNSKRVESIIKSFRGTSEEQK